MQPPTRPHTRYLAQWLFMVGIVKGAQQGMGHLSSYLCDG